LIIQFLTSFPIFYTTAVVCVCTTIFLLNSLLEPLPIPLTTGKLKIRFSRISYTHVWDLYLATNVYLRTAYGKQLLRKYLHYETRRVRVCTYNWFAYIHTCTESSRKREREREKRMYSVYDVGISRARAVIDRPTRECLPSFRLRTYISYFYTCVCVCFVRARVLYTCESVHLRRSQILIDTANTSARALYYTRTYIRYIYVCMYVYPCRESSCDNLIIH